MEIADTPTRGSLKKQWDPKMLRSIEKIRNDAKSSTRKKYDRQRHSQRTSSDSLYPKWMKPYNNRVDVGKLSVRCPYCLALRFENEKYRCCDEGKVYFNEPRLPPPLLLNLLDSRTDIGHKHINYLCKLNTLFSFGARQNTTENIPGRGVPITKIRGVTTHTSSTVYAREGGTPRFGALYALETKEATELRLNNDMLIAGISKEVIIMTLINLNYRFLSVDRRVV